MFTVIWHWLDVCSAWLTATLGPKAGGESFVQLWTALNIAFIGWDKYQNVLNIPRDRHNKIINDTASSLLETDKRRLVEKFRQWSRLSLRLHAKVWLACLVLAGISTASGIWMLYVGCYNPLDFLVAVPTIGYAACSIINLLIFWAFSRFLGWSCGVSVDPSKNTAAVSEEVTALMEKTRPARTGGGSLPSEPWFSSGKVPKSEK